MKRSGLKCKPSKCEILKDSVKYLGRMVDKHCIRPDPDAVEPVLTWKSPKTEHQLMSFLGFANYYREFVKVYADKVYPMQQLMRHKEEKIRHHDRELQTDPSSGTFNLDVQEIRGGEELERIAVSRKPFRELSCSSNVRTNLVPEDDMKVARRIVCVKLKDDVHNPGEMNGQIMALKELVKTISQVHGPEHEQGTIDVTGAANGGSVSGHQYREERA
ncbi:uncharacterized protein LOC134844833 [Symsagittifera roscoffensis]|uniref:uncharacterized protein LOC134844833 n=1 Tax=Symsagittifera roscoffensis TaxID=84072 RepID=UPI00307B7BA8